MYSYRYGRVLAPGTVAGTWTITKTFQSERNSIVQSSTGTSNCTGTITYLYCNSFCNGSAPYCPGWVSPCTSTSFFVDVHLARNRKKVGICLTSKKKGFEKNKLQNE